MKNDKLENVRVKYQTSLSLYASEGQIQWSRYNAMLLVNTLLFTLIGLDKDINLISLPLLSRFVPLFGLILCGLWYRMTDRGFMWMNHWICEAKKLEGEIKGQFNPIQAGEELRSKVGGNVTRNASLLIIIIFILLYFSFAIVKIGSLIVQK